MMRSNLGEISFELKYKKNGENIVITGVANADIIHDVEYEDYGDYYLRSVPVHQETKVTLNNIKGYEARVKREQPKFFIDNIPAPFDYYWEIEQIVEQRRMVYYDEEYPRNERIEIFNVPEKNAWWLKMVSTESEDKTLRRRIMALDDDTIRNTAKDMVTNFVARNRAKALEEGPVRLADES